jgi:hypothetical protein
VTKPESVVGENVIEAMLQTLKTTPAEGCIVEVGVYRGGTLWHLVHNAEGRPVYGYDTFGGMPFQDEGDSHRVGDFADTSLAAVQAAVPDAILISGTFPRSLIEMPSIAFAHVDCDQYQSIKDCINVLGPKMLAGGVMWFDDYGCLPSANRAVDEAFGKGRLIMSSKAFVRF